MGRKFDFLNAGDRTGWGNCLLCAILVEVSKLLIGALFDALLLVN